MTNLEKAREIVGQWEYQGKGYDITMPFSEHKLNHLASAIAAALDAKQVTWPTKEEQEKARWEEISRTVRGEECTNSWDAAINWLKQRSGETK